MADNIGLDQEDDEDGERDEFGKIHDYGHPRDVPAYWDPPTLSEIERERNQLEAALLFYANRDHWKRRRDENKSMVDQDGGRVAREALRVKG